MKRCEERPASNVVDFVSFFRLEQSLSRCQSATIRAMHHFHSQHHVVCGGCPVYLWPLVTSHTSPNWWTTPAGHSVHEPRLHTVSAHCHFAFISKLPVDSDRWHLEFNAYRVCDLRGKDREKMLSGPEEKIVDNSRPIDGRVDWRVGETVGWLTGWWLVGWFMRSFVRSFTTSD